MSEIKLAGLSAEGEEREYELSGFKGCLLYTSDAADD